MDPKQIVRDGYDKVSHTYRDDTGSEAEARYRPWIAELSRQLNDSAHVLDLGCGNGVPAARLLAERFRVTGVDISPVQIDRARRLVPQAQFQCADMSALRFEPESFDAVISFYAIIHVPIDEQPGLLARIATWLMPGGRFVATLGKAQWTGVEDDWLGVQGATMYWSHADCETYSSWLRESGFEVLSAEVIRELDGDHCLFHAIRRGG